MSNAFCCSQRPELYESIEAMVAPEDHQLMRERVANNFVYIQVNSDEKVAVLPQHGGLQGTTEAPRLFVKSFEKPIKGWADSRSITSPSTMLYTDIVGKPIDGSLTLFADDVFKKHVCDKGEAREAWAIADNSTFVINEQLSEHKYAQNESKRELVPSLSKRGANKEFSKLVASQKGSGGL